jgi:ABC-type nitrate/sulfonate/bicarbonate transport system ATPase subunit
VALFPVAVWDARNGRRTDLRVCGMIVIGVLLDRLLVRVLTERPRTVVFVTHDIGEAAQTTDRIVVLSESPAHLINELRLEVERPRDPMHPAVVGTVKTILDEPGLREGAPELSAVN